MRWRRRKLATGGVVDQSMIVLSRPTCARPLYRVPPEWRNQPMGIVTFHADISKEKCDEIAAAIKKQFLDQQRRNGPGWWA